MIKLFVTDLDGTLLNHHKHVDYRDIQYMNLANDQGVHICFASGRMNSELRVVMGQFERTFYSIGQNGATVHTNDNTVLSSTLFRSDLPAKLCRLSKKYNFIEFVHSGNDSYYYTDRSGAAKPYESRLFMRGTPCEDLESVVADAAFQPSKFSYFGKIETLKEMQREVNELFKGEIETFISDKDCLDIMPLNVSKGVGLSVLLDHLGLQPEEVACIGDSFNDLPMFAIIPHNFAMAGSLPEVKEKAKYTAISVAEAVKWVLSYNSTLQNSNTEAAQ
jgi:hypothetical protein